MRCFIGIDLSIREKIALETWRERAIPGVQNHKANLDLGYHTKGAEHANKNVQAYGVPAANFHITLCFNGHITPIQHEKLCCGLDDIKIDPFDVTLNTTGFWAKPKILFVAPISPPKQLASLANACQKIARRAGISIEKRDYKPHVTLIRKATESTPSPLLPLDISVSVKEFHLFESFSDKQGLHYPIRHSWPLVSSLSVRDQLKQGLVGR